VNSPQPKPPSQLGGVIAISVFVVLFGSIAGLFLWGAFSDIDKEARIASDPVQVMATVVDVEPECSLETSSCNYVPTVVFIADGTTVRRVLESVGGKLTHQVGDEFLVDYQSGFPDTAVESSKRGEVRDVFIIPIVFATIALAFAVFGSVNWFAFRRRFWHENGRGDNGVART
jgi:hypothetical protein